MQYLSNPRKEILTLIDFSNVKDIVEFGCSDGATLLEIVDNYPDINVCGYDLDEASLSLAKQAGINSAVLDINNINQLNEIIPNIVKSDIFLLLDVLEHLPTPEKFLLFLREHSKKDAVLIISLPNVRNWRTFIQLLNNDWRYEETGIFDETHLKFYAKKSAIRLAQTYGELVSFEYRLTGGVFKRLLQKTAPSFFCGQMFCVVRRG